MTPAMKKRIKRNRGKATSTLTHFLTRVAWARLRRRGVRVICDGTPLWSAVPYLDVTLLVGFAARVKAADKRLALFREIHAAFAATVPAGFTLMVDEGPRYKIGFLGASGFAPTRRAEAQALVDAFVKVTG
jgi:hypothetical protein